MSSDSYSSVDSNANSVDEEAERLQAAVEVVAEMQLTAEQLKVTCGWFLFTCTKATEVIAAVGQVP